MLATSLIHDTDGDEHVPDAGLRQTALTAIRSHLGMEVAFISEFVDGRRVFRQVDPASSHCPVRVGQSDPLEETYCQRVVDGRLPELIPDARACPAAAELPVTARLPVGAHLSVPIRLADGRVYGTFCCFSTTPDQSLNTRDLAMMRVIAELAAAEINRDIERERDRIETVSRVEAAIAGDGLRMVFQPIVDIDSRGPVGFEALARFNLAPRRSPDVWFAEAARVGLGVDLELAAIRRALPGLGELPGPAYLALNISPSTAVSGRLDEVLRDVPAHRVVLEITEHAAIEGYEQLDDALRWLRRRGVRVAVDDAGGGYASFRHVLSLRPNVIKLDMTLTRDIDRDPPRRALAKALIAFARDTGSSLVAEGIETNEELEALRQLGVDAAQGYLLGKPAELGSVRRPEALARS